MLLARRGFVVDALGLAATIAAAGALLAFAGQWPDVLEETHSYALLVGLVGLGNMVACTLGGGRSVSTPG